jgi:hypothetical protein
VSTKGEWLSRAADEEVEADFGRAMRRCGQSSAVHREDFHGDRPKDARPKPFLRGIQAKKGGGVKGVPVDGRAKRLECAELAPAFGCAAPSKSASKLAALQTLRAVRLRPCRAGESEPARERSGEKR